MVPRADPNASTARIGIFIPGTADAEIRRNVDVLPIRPIPREESNFSTTATAGPTFRGNPVNINPDPSVNTRGRDYGSYDGRLPGGNPTTSRRGRLFDHTSARTPMLRTPT